MITLLHLIYHHLIAQIAWRYDKTLPAITKPLGPIRIVLYCKQPRVKLYLDHKQQQLRAMFFTIRAINY